MKKRIFAITSLLLLIPLLFSCFPQKPADTQAKTETTAADPLQTSPVTEPVTEHTAEESGDTSAEIPAVSSADPVVNGSVLLNATTVMVYGKCEKDCVINVYNGEQSFTVTPDGDNFCFAAQVKTDEETVITVKAKTEGCAESAGVTVTAQGDGGTKDSGLTVSYGSRVFEKKILADLYGANAFTEKELAAMKKLAKSRVSNARKASGKNTRIIYAIAPCPLSVYDEELTESMRSHIENRSARLKQAAAALSDVDGVTFIDLTDILVSNKDKGKLYYKLDSHWTELGAYFGYKAIMDRISEKFPSAAPHPLSDYKIKYVAVDDTDMNVYSGVGTGEMYEDAPFLRARFVEQTPYGKSKDQTARIWDYVNKYFRTASKTSTGDASKPSAVLLMDSFGLNAVSFLAESFNVLAVQPVWYYNADYGLIAEVEADYVIEILEERDLGVLLSGT
ncbi:MAG: hypothetical protein II777_03530 [Clostridia bacterium]|nr:hypothetical protein [Clostridia bacterium]